MENQIIGNPLDSNQQGHSIRKEGVVLEAFPGASFKIQLDEGREVLAYLSGKMRLHHIKVLPGDRVTVEFSPYDEQRGRIVYRSK